MTPPDLTRRLAARKLAAARLATDLILDCERAASGRNRKRADPARWTETDWRSLSPRRGPIARDLKASAALSRDRRHRGCALRPLTPGRLAADPAPSRPSPIRDKQRLDMNLALRKPMTLAEFLEWEERQPLRYEFDGVGPVAMTGGTSGHSTIQGNLAIALGGRLRGKPCRFHGSDLKFQVAEGHVRYPDGMVIVLPASIGPRPSFTTPSSSSKC